MQPKSDASPHNINTGPLNYDDSAQLMADIPFRGRIKVACLHFAQYIIGEATNTVAHSTRYRWAQNAYQNPDNAAMQVQPAVVMDPSVQAAGSSIADGPLQTAVETAIQAFL